AVLVLELDAEVIKNITILRVGADESAAGSDSLHRRAAHGPVDHINVVYMLLNDMVAAGPVKVEPVAHLPFHVAHLRGAVYMPQAFLHPVALAAHDVVNGAILDPLHGFDVALGVTALCACHDSQALFLRHLRS